MAVAGVCGSAYFRYNGVWEMHDVKREAGYLEVESWRSTSPPIALATRNLIRFIFLHRVYPSECMGRHLMVHLVVSLFLRIVGNES